MRRGNESYGNHFWAIELPLTMVRGTGVKFVADTTIRLQSQVNPLSTDFTCTPIIVAKVIILARLAMHPNQWITGVQTSYDSIKLLNFQVGANQVDEPLSLNSLLAEINEKRN